MRTANDVNRTPAGLRRRQRASRRETGASAAPRRADGGAGVALRSSSDRQRHRRYFSSAIPILAQLSAFHPYRVGKRGAAYVSGSLK